MASTSNIRQLFFLAFVFVYLSLHVGIKADGCQQFSLISPPMGSCPGSNITYTCGFSSTDFGVTTVWSGSAFQSQCAANEISLAQRVSGMIRPFIPVPCGFLTAMTTNVTSPCYTSVLMISAVQALNGAIVVCSNSNSPTSIGSDTLRIISPPGPPSVVANTTGPDMVQVVVNPSTSGGLPTSYNVTISNSSYVYSKTTTAFPDGSAMVTFTGAGLTNNTNYTISSVAINCAGPSNSSDPTTILVSWQAPPPPPSTSSPSIPTTTPTPTRSSGTTTTEDPNIGVIIGAVVGGVVFIILSVIAIILLYCLCKTYTSNDEKDGGDGVHLSKDGKVGSDVNLELQESHSEQGNVEPVLPPRDCNVFEALYEGAVGGNVPTGNMDDSKYSTTKKNMEVLHVCWNIHVFII